jgi:hypothetical protein
VRSRATARFWRLYEALPADVQQQADKSYGLWRDNPRHPSLHFKQLSGRGGRFSVRIGIHHRAVGWKPESSLVEWVWIGTHAEYDQLIG